MTKFTRLGFIQIIYGFVSVLMQKKVKFLSSHDLFWLPISSDAKYGQFTVI